MKPAYYNEFDEFAAQWLRNLIAAGLIPDGEVDERSIKDVEPADLAGFTQCHFFAGIGGWALAARIAGWPEDRQLWTGSCPCQPFSSAGLGNGFADDRHLWPQFFRLIRERNPAAVFGEQVASKNADEWLDLVQSDLEAMGYAFGAVAFPAAGVGAPHIRDRIYWVGDAHHQGLERHTGHGGAARWAGPGRPAAASGVSGGMADAAGQRRGELGELGKEESDRIREVSREGLGVAELGRGGTDGDAGPTNGLWRDADWLYCRDGRWRPVEPGTFPLAHGIPGRVGRLRAYGNAIVPQQAAEFLKAWMDVAP